MPSLASSALPLRVAVWALCLVPLAHAAQQPSAAEISHGLAEMSLDPDQTYHVRDLTLARGDIKIFLTEGILSFVTPTYGRCVGAVFTTAGVEAGEGEIIVMPPDRSERASLASFTGRPNLDEHFTSALLLFTDDTEKELLSQIREGPVRKAPETATEHSGEFNPLIRQMSSGVALRIVQSLLDNHKPEQGLFYSAILGRELGPFDAMYEPDESEPVAVGRSLGTADGHSRFQLWTAFRPRHKVTDAQPPANLSDFHIETTIRPDLSMSVTARFQAALNTDGGRVIPLGLSDRLHVSSGKIDGTPVEVFQRNSIRMLDMKGSGTFLLVSAGPLVSGKVYSLEVSYEGSVIRQTPDGSYFVDERNAWFPYSGPMQANFDLVFRCPERLRLVSTGEPVSEEVAGGIRTVHRKTRVPERLAGFNLGDYTTSFDEHGLYRVECYANAQSASGSSAALQELPKEIEGILDDYTQRWVKLPIHDIAVSPIPGYFGQGFPGLIYLSTVSYVREQDRPSQLRSARMDMFFSEMLLPHEVAHQWWGNIVGASDYRADWLMEAMANYSALEFLERHKGRAAVNDVLTTYRDDLTKEEHGKPVESAGPVDFGIRLQQTVSLSTWHTIVYEKGTWILHMLRERLGEESFGKLQLRLLHDFAAKPISNEAFRQAAGEFVPAGQSDKNLALFFETWVYGTGIPRLALKKSGRDVTLDVSGVDEDFTTDVPLRCISRGGAEKVRWIRASSGSNDVERLSSAGSCELPSSNEFLYVPTVAPAP